MRRKHIITLLIACFATLSTWAGDVLTFRPITDVSQLKSGARTLIGAEWYGKYYVLHNDLSPNRDVGNDGYEVTLNSDGCLAYTREQLHTTHEVNSEKPILFRMTCRNEGSHADFELSLYDDLQYYWVPSTSDTPFPKKSLVFRNSGMYFDSSWEASFNPQDLSFWSPSEEYAINNAHIFIGNLYGSTSHYISYLMFRGPETGVSKRGFTTNSSEEYNLLEYFSDESKIIDTHIVLFQETECKHDAVDLAIFNGIAPTCTTPGRSVVKYCKGCNKFFNADLTHIYDTYEGDYLNPLGHAAEGDHCSRCGKPLGKYGFDSNYSYSSYYGGLYTSGQNWTLCAKGEDGKLYAPGFKRSANGKGIEAVELTPYSAGNNTYYIGNDKDFAWVGFTRASYSSSYEFYNGDARLELSLSDEPLCIGEYQYNTYELRWAHKDRITFPSYYPWRGSVNTGNWDSWRGESKDGYVDLYYTDGYVYHSVSLLKDEEGNYYYGLVTHFDGQPDPRADWQKNVKHIMAGCPHEHLQLVPATDATCSKPGNQQHYVCENTECNATFSDTDLHDQWGDFSIPATGHNYVDGTCTICGQPALTYRLVTDPQQINTNGRYIIVAKVPDGKSEMTYVMGNVDEKYSYGTAPAIPAYTDTDGYIPVQNGFMELRFVEVPRGSVYNPLSMPQYYIVSDGGTFRTYKGIDLHGLNLDPDVDFISQMQKMGIFDNSDDYLSDDGKMQVYLNGVNWTGGETFAKINGLEPFNAVIYPTGTFNNPDHSIGFVNSGKENFFCTWYEANSNTELPGVPVYLYYGFVSDKPVTSFDSHYSSAYIESEEPLDLPEVIEDVIMHVSSLPETKPLASLDLRKAKLVPGITAEDIKDALVSAKSQRRGKGDDKGDGKFMPITLSQNFLLIMPDDYMPGKEDLTNVVLHDQSSKAPSKYNTPNLVLTDKESFHAPIDLGFDAAEYTRTLTDKWSTLCLPMDCDVPDGLEAYEPLSVDLDNMTISFSDCNGHITQGRSVIIRRSSGAGEAVVTFSAYGGRLASTATYNDLTFRGTYAPIPAGTPERAGFYILGNDNAFHPAGPNATIPPFRAFLTVSDSSDGKYDGKDDGKYDGIKKSNLRIVFDTPTGLFTIGQQKLLQITLRPGTVTLRGEAGREVTIVDAAGRLVKRLRLAAEETTVSLPAGIYVVNGTKVSVK